MTKKLLYIIGLAVASATLFGSGWWSSAYFGDRSPHEHAPKEPAESRKDGNGNEREEQYKPVKISIPEYEQLQKAKWVNDLPRPFESVFYKGKTEDFGSILYSEGMPEDLANDLTEKVALLSKGYQTIHHGVGENRWRTFNAGIHEDRRLRYLIYPTHFMVFSVFNKAGPPTELAFGLALTGDGIKVIGMKYADITSLDEAEGGAGQPATRSESKSEDNQNPKPGAEGRSR